MTRMPNTPQGVKRCPSQLVALTLSLGLVSVMTLGGCGENALPITVCPDKPVASIDIFNYYADHSVADVHRVDAPGEVEALCSELSADAQGIPSDVPDEELNQRQVTVYDIHAADGTRTTLWVHRLVGFDADSVLVTDSGERYILGGWQMGSPYRHNDVTVVDRSLVPQPRAK